MKLKLIYDRRSVDQTLLSVGLLPSGAHDQILVFCLKITYMGYIIFWLTLML
jgi:hypothetical protein